MFDAYYPNEEDHWHRHMWKIDPFVANIKESKLNMSEKKAPSIYLATTVSKLYSSHLCQDLIFGSQYEMNTHHSVKMF